ncbi:DUF2478 domain-containing protein [Azonexus hydrophilus]|uniref:DUF2478 domain-containing protein n=1 Tax=Azonexus hydrophilus TaxID=418702 RepID=UPI0009F9B82A|nr:DUF2478 domain-containing protein [Azonexus hydrophilus]
MSLPSQNLDDDPLLIAAVVPPPGINADLPVRAFVADLRARGVRVAGLLQDMLPTASGCNICLVDIETGDSYPISQRLGSQSASCTLDPGALADASRVMRRIAEDGAELVVFNRFSGMEAEGDGFAGEMLDFMSCAIPVLTIVQEKHLPAWRHFTGGMACELPPEAQALDDWYARLGR